MLTTACTAPGLTGLELGADARQIRRSFPAGQLHETPAGYSVLRPEASGTTHAYVFLVTPDRRIAARFHVSVSEGAGGEEESGSYRLTGAVDAQALRLGGLGPLDTLRAVADQLTSAEVHAGARAAQHWVAAGLVRMLQQHPQVDDPGPATARVGALLARIPAGGDGDVRPVGSGQLHIFYCAR